MFSLLLAVNGWIAAFEPLAHCTQINNATPAITNVMPPASRAVVGCLKTKYEIAWANSTSINARVRTLAMLVMAKARNQNSDAVAPMKPANSEGFHARMMAWSTARSRMAR